MHERFITKTNRCFTFRFDRAQTVAERERWNWSRRSRQRGGVIEQRNRATRPVIHRRREINKEIRSLRRDFTTLRRSHRERRRWCHHRREIKKERRNRRLNHPAGRDHETSFGIETDHLLPFVRAIEMRERTRKRERDERERVETL